MRKHSIMNKIKIPIIKFIGQGAISSKILQTQAIGLQKLSTYCGGKINMETEGIGISYVIMN